MSVLIGSTPADWTDAQLADFCELIPGAPTQDDPNGSVPVLKPKNLVSGKLTGPTDKMDAAEAEQRPRYRVTSGDLLCARTGTVGRVGLAENDQAGWIFGSGLICIRIKPSTQVDPQFLGFYFAHPAVSDWVTRHARGTSIPNISSRVLGTLPISLPPLSVQRAIGHALVTLNDSIEAHQRIYETTAELRDALLPLLLSGELPAS
jgi:type I restriction enzyme M protein